MVCVRVCVCKIFIMKNGKESKIGRVLISRNSSGVAHLWKKILPLALNKFPAKDVVFIMYPKFLREVKTCMYLTV